METIANAMGYVCISMPVNQRLRIQLSDNVTINHVNEELFDLVSEVLIHVCTFVISCFV